jgi:hypothetical protein
MLRRILRLLPHSSQSSNKFPAVFRQRTIVAPLQVRPWLFVCLGVSVATFATITTIHADATQAPDDDQMVQIPKSSARDYLLAQKTPPSPTTDELFDLSSESGVKEKSIGIIRVDTILLARYVHEQCPIYFVYRSYFSQIIATNPAKTSCIKEQLNSLIHSTTLCLEFMMDITEIR